MNVEQIVNKYRRLRFTDQGKEMLSMMITKANETNTLELLDENFNRMNNLFSGKPNSYLQVYADFSLPNFSLGFTVMSNDQGVFYGGLVWHESSQEWAMHS